MGRTPAANGLGADQSTDANISIADIRMVCFMPQPYLLQPELPLQVCAGTVAYVESNQPHTAAKVIIAQQHGIVYLVVDQGRMMVS